MADRTSLNNQLNSILTAIVDIPQHLQANQAMLDYVDASIGEIPNSLSGLSDVQISTIGNRHYLHYNLGSGKWENNVLIAEDIPELNMSKVSTGNLAWTRVSGTPTTLSGFGITDSVVLTTGTYGNPSWLTSMAWSKLTGTPTTLAGYGITDSIVLTTGTYANPSWLTSLAWSKLTGTPTTISGYGITDAVSTTNATSTYVPYTGANSNLNLGTKTLTAGGATINGSLSTTGAVSVGTTFSAWSSIQTANNRYSVSANGTNINIDASSATYYTNGANSYGALIPAGGSARWLFGTTTDDGSNAVQVNGASKFSGKVQVAGSVTSSSSVARGLYLNNVLTTSANNDVLVALDVAPSFSNGGAYSGVTNIAARFTSGFVIVGASTPSAGVTAGLQVYGSAYVSSNFTVNSMAGTGIRAVVADAAGGFGASDAWTISGNNIFMNPASANVTNNATFAVNYSGIPSYAAGAALAVRGGAFFGDNGSTDAGGALSASSGTGRGVYMRHGLKATANNDALIGVHISPTFYDQSFTGVSHTALKIDNGGISQTGGTNFFNSAGTSRTVIGTNTDNGSDRLQVSGSAKVTGKLNLGTAADYSDNAAALAAGLVTGDIYRTGDTLKIVH